MLLTTTTTFIVGGTRAKD